MEDFIGGIAPQLNNESLSYCLKEGVFKTFCDTAANAEKETDDNKFVFVIDEINRADLSAVFGELMYALEYRGEPIHIPNFKEDFVIPNNVYIIGTMNNVDKSLVNFDIALRRRFAFYYVGPNEDALMSILNNCQIPEQELEEYVERCKALNAEIENSTNALQLGSNFMIGHAYFGKIKFYISTDELLNSETSCHITSYSLEKIWSYHIEPLLIESLGNRIDMNDVKNALAQLKESFTAPLNHD